MGKLLFAVQKAIAEYGGCRAVCVVGWPFLSREKNSVMRKCSLLSLSPLPGHGLVCRHVLVSC